MIFSLAVALFGATVSSASKSTCLPQEGIVNLELELIHKVKLLTVYSGNGRKI
jgi:hypothetical protein